MKKFFTGFIVGLLLTTAIAIAASQAIYVTLGQVKLVVDGTLIDQETILYNDSTYVPVRVVAEQLDQTVQYDSITETVFIGGYMSIQEFSDKYSQSIIDYGDLDFLTMRYQGKIVYQGSVNGSEGLFEIIDRFLFINETRFLSLIGD